QTDRLDRVISDVLDLTRIESGAVVPLLRPVAAIDLIEEAAERSASATGERDVSIEVESGLAVLTDESLVVQALINLLDNAARYSRPDGAIRLAACSQGDRELFTIEDDGPGIDPTD